MKAAFFVLALLGGVMYWMLGSESEHTDTPVASFAMNDTNGLLRSARKMSHEIDYQVTSDGNGSLRIDADRRALVDLYNVWGEEKDLGLQQIVYKAKLKTRDASGEVYLVMQAGFSGAPEGSMPVVGKTQSITGTTDWTPMEIKAGNPIGSKLLESTLQVHIDGPGTVWIDDVALVTRQYH